MLRTLSVLLIISAMLVLPGRHAGAAQSAVNEWDETTPTGWYWYYNQTADNVTATISSLNQRIVDLEVQQVNPLRFAAAYVQNTGAHESGWWWYYGLDEDGVNDYLSQNNARLLDLEAYETNGVLRFAVVMVPNTGADAKAWWWYFGMSPQEILDKASQNNARAIDVEPYEFGGQTFYAAVYIRNSGADQNGWWVYINQTPTEIGQKITQNEARLIDIWQQPDGDFGVVMQACPCPAWWWYVGVTEAQLNQVVNQNAARIIDLDTYEVNNVRLFAAVLINNADPITTRVGELLRAQIVQPNGLYGDASAGLYLRLDRRINTGGPLSVAQFRAGQHDQGAAAPVRVQPHRRRFCRARGRCSALQLCAEQLSGHQYQWNRGIVDGTDRDDAGLG